MPWRNNPKGVPMKKCTKCNVEKDISCFGTKGKQSHLYFSHCRECDAARKRKNPLDKIARSGTAKSGAQRRKEWALRHPIQAKAVSLEYAAKRRSQCKVGSTKREVAEWLSRQEKRCYWCNDNNSVKYHVDHVVPLCKGGVHQISNFVVACSFCNTSKGGKLLEDWMDWLECH